MRHLCLPAILLVFSGSIFSQGLINNGAYIEVGPGAFVYIDGGLSTGNFVNQDIGAFTGVVENQGTIDVTGDWTNLSAFNVFNSSNGTVRLPGANQSISGTTSTYFNNLTLLGSGTKTLNIATLCGGGFALPNGILDLTTLPLDLNGFRLTVNNPANTAITNSSGYIISETPAAINPSIIQWNMGATNGVYNYPFGVNAVQIPFTLGKTAGNGNVSVSTRATSLSNNSPWEASVTNMISTVVAGPGEIPVVIDRWWDVEPSAPVTAGMTFTYRGLENTTTYNPTGTFSAQNWNGAQWLFPVGAGPGVLFGTAAVTIPAQVLVSTPWILSNLEAPLPVELLTFKASCNNLHEINISWTTATENNNSFFILEKSVDGIHYSFLTKMLSKGNSVALQHYVFTDNFPFAEKTFYQLSQTDINGNTETFSPVVIKACKNDGNNLITAWNYGYDIHMQANTNESTVYTASVYDTGGRLVTSKLVSFLPGNTEMIWPINTLSNGVYFLNLRNNNDNQFFKMLFGYH